MSLQILSTVDVEKKMTNCPNRELNQNVGLYEAHIQFELISKKIVFVAESPQKLRNVA